MKQQRDFIFGYGSLIDEDSRRRTIATEAAHAARVRGLQRAWEIRSVASRKMAVGVGRRPGSTCNGVVFPVTAEQLAAFDQRELPYGYRRATIDRVNGLDLEILDEAANLDLGGPVEVTESSREQGPAVVWYYETEAPQRPAPEYPLAQSYVDICLDGCFDYGEPFAREFIETTAWWPEIDGAWADDRERQRYIRPQAARRPQEIDRLLSEIIPVSFATRRKAE